MIHQLRDQFRACLHSQLTHWNNLTKLERLLAEATGGGADPFYRRLQDMICTMCIELESTEMILDRGRLHDEDLEAVVIEVADELNIELPGRRLPPRFRS